MATGTPTKQGEVSTVCDKNVNNSKLSSDTGIGTRSKGLRRSLRGTRNIGNPVKDNIDRLTPGATEPNEPKSINEQRGKKDAEANGVVPAASASMDKSEVYGFINYRVDTKASTVDIHVEWEGGKTTWEAERDLQEKVPALVYKYWDGLGGRDTATRLKLYRVFKILKRASPPEKSKDARYTHIVQWVGYRPTESSPECESKLQKIAPQELEKFEAKELERGAVKSQKRKNICSPGGPRKKARGANN